MSLYVQATFKCCGCKSTKFSNIPYFVLRHQFRHEFRRVLHLIKKKLPIDAGTV